MRVSKIQAEQNRERVLNLAARLFRERGFDGIGVAELMKHAGLTHGGFYGQFASKEELMAEAIDRAFEQALAYWQQKARDAEQQTPGSAFDAVVKAYLSTTHRDRVDEGCVMAALSTDTMRQSRTVRARLTDGFSRFIDSMGGLFRGEPPAVKRKKALVMTSTLVGALMLARAVEDEALSEEILLTVAQAMLDSHAAFDRF